MPQQFGIATQERHVDLVMNITDFNIIRCLVETNTHFLFVFEFRWTVPFDGTQHLRVLADALGAVQDHVFQVRTFFGKLRPSFLQFGMQIVFFISVQIFFKMGFMEFHRITKETMNSLFVNQTKTTRKEEERKEI
jgi:hypothetical protein